MKDFFTDDEQKEMNEMFRNNVFGDYVGHNYSFLNYPKNEWNPAILNDTLNNSHASHKGIHPIRVNNEIMNHFNTILLKHSSAFLKPQKYYIYEHDGDRYMCDGFFMIRTNNYRRIVDDDSLFFPDEDCDEIPVNRYSAQENLKKICIGNSFTIHPYYNSNPMYLQLEYTLFTELTKKTLND
jgi:hypothetical protein